MWDPIHVVHVVQDSVVRAPRKYHAPLTITVNSGLLRSVENADHAASICKGAGRGSWAPLVGFFAKVRVAGSNPVVCSREGPGSREIPVPGRQVGSGSLATLHGRGSGSWATLAPVRGRHLIRAGRARWFLAVDDPVRDQGGTRCFRNETRLRLHCRS